MLITAKPVFLRLSFLAPNSVAVKPYTISTRNHTRNTQTIIFCSSDSTPSSASSSSSSSSAVTVNNAPPMLKKRKRYRRLYPGESTGITEEMRFVAMRLRNINGKNYSQGTAGHSDVEQGNEEEDCNLERPNGDDNGSEGDTWQPSMEGFLKYLVDSKLVFSTIECIVDESEDVSFAYFRKTGLERSQSLSKDLEWLSQEGLTIPVPSSPGLSYVNYLEELAKKSAPLFLSHFYNIYFSHIAGGQVIARQVSEKLLEGKEMEFYRWEGDVQELLKDFREKLNMLGEHWSRDDKNRCLKEATKSFRFMGQIINPRGILRIKQERLNEFQQAERSYGSARNRSVGFLIEDSLLWISTFLQPRCPLVIAHRVLINFSLLK